MDLCENVQTPQNLQLCKENDVDVNFQNLPSRKVVHYDEITFKKTHISVFMNAKVYKKHSLATLFLMPFDSECMIWQYVYISIGCDNNWRLAYFPCSKLLDKSALE